MKLGFGIFITLIMCLNFISASYLPHQRDTDFSFSFADNIAGSCNITSINYPNGLIWINQGMSKTGNTFSATIGAGNFSTLGDYCINIECSDGTGDICREITPDGKKSGNGLLIGRFLIWILIGLILSFLGYKGNVLSEAGEGETLGILAWFGLIVCGISGLIIIEDFLSLFVGGMMLLIGIVEVFKCATGVYETSSWFGGY